MKGSVTEKQRKMEGGRGETQRERERDIKSSTHGFIPKMVAMAEVGPDQSHEQAASSGSSTQV